MRCDAVLVAEHRRCWAAQTISDPVHVRAAAQLRSRRRLSAATVPSDGGVVYRDLADYDRILGLDEEAAS